MDMLYAPWRSEYTGGDHEGKKEGIPQKNCVFCQQIQGDHDSENGIIKRFKHSVIMLNKYPYNAGHALILPTEHAQSLAELTKDTRAELMELTNISIETVKQALKAEGINVGINLGRAAGAGIPSHLHIHILPRWGGDTSFMLTLGETKVISFDLTTIYTTLKKSFASIEI